jgi:hypothetical protein
VTPVPLAQPNEGADRVGAIVHDALAPWLAARYPDRVLSRSR